MIIDIEKINRIVLLLLFIISFPLAADTLIFHNGDKLEGTLVGQSRDIFYIRVDGNVRAIPKEKVRDLDYGKTGKEEKEREEIERQPESDEVEQAIKKAEAKLKKEEEKQSQEMEQRSSLTSEPENEKLEIQNEEKQGLAAKFKSLIPAGALWRSALVPGWEQYHKGDKIKGGAFFLAMFTSMNLFFHAHQSQAVAMSDIESAGHLGIVGAARRSTNPSANLLAVSLENDANERLKYYSNRKFFFSLITIGIYAYNLYDAYFQGASFAPEQQAANRFRYTIVQKAEFTNGKPDYNTAVQFSWSY